MKSKLLLFFSLVLISNLIAQVKYTEHTLPPLEKEGIVNFSDNLEDFAPNWHVSKAPPVNGDSYQAYLIALKEESAKKYPKRNILPNEPRGGAEAPVITRTIWGNTSASGSPLDNHIAVNNDEQVISVINSDITIKNSAGVTLSSTSLEAFADLNDVFDPRVNYDPVADRFYMTMLSGRDINSDIILAFTETNDATGNWFKYRMSGNPFDDGTWSDYPMITFTDTEYILTMNSLRNYEGWVEGFSHTLIYQWKKEEALKGEALNMKIWTDIEYNGQSIRNVHPVKSATGEPGDNFYMLSNRNFDMQNDSIFILEITGKHDDPATELKIDVQKMDIPYGAPPFATQPSGTLWTNDARVLDSYLLGDKIQFAGNTINFDNGHASIYHGTVHDITGERSITANIISSATEEYGYPSIAYTGIEAEDTDAIMIFSHTGADRNPGYSAMYIDNDGLYSPLVTVKEGQNYIDMFSNNVDERWGDYSGNQRNYANPGEVWVASSYGNTSKRNGTWLGEIIRPDLFVATEEIEEQMTFKAFPNPTADRFSIEIDAMDIEHLYLSISDLNGRTIHTFSDGRPVKQGIIDFSFSTKPLSTGTYLLNIQIDGKQMESRKIVVSK